MSAPHGPNSPSGHAVTVRYAGRSFAPSADGTSCTGAIEKNDTASGAASRHDGTALD